MSTAYAGLSIESLIEKVLMSPQGDHFAFQELVSRSKGKILANCWYLCQSADAEDLAQEVFLKIYFNLKSYQFRSNFTTWSHRIKINHCLNYLNKRKKDILAESTTLDVQSITRTDTNGIPEPKSGSKKKGKSIHEVLNTMPEKLRFSLILCDMDGLSYNEAAEELGIGLSALKMRLKRAREYFREHYNE